MKHYLKYVLTSLFIVASFGVSLSVMAGHAPESEEKELNVKELILDHLGDSYEWHIATIGKTHISIPLPVIVVGEQGDLNVFMSSKFEHGHAQHNGFYIAPTGDNKNKIVELNASGEEVRPWDFSLTKNAVALIIASILLTSIILYVARWYKRQAVAGTYEAPKGFVGLMEMFILSIQDDIIKPCVGKNYKKFSPYLLTAFFFIFTNNILGLIPIFPAGANVTGNISVTLVLGLFTFFIVNIFGSKEYWKEIFWPDVPVWLKSPIMPLMPLIELVSVFTKPFALIVRLFANIMAGHSIVLGLTCLIFVTANMGTAINSSMTLVSVLLSIFIGFVEILVAYIQAYVFTMLSAVFIGLAQVEPHHHASHEVSTKSEQK